MRILQVYRDHFSRLPGGVERHVHELAHGLSHLGHVDVLASSRTRRNVEFLDGPVSVTLKREWGRPAGMVLCPGFLPAIGASTHDVVHIHCLDPTAEIAALIRRPRGALIATYHADLHRSPLLGRAYAPIVHRFLRSCDRVIVSSGAFIETSPVIARIAAAAPKSIEVVPFGVDTGRFAPAPTEASRELRRSWGPRPIVLFVGRLRHYKGLEYLVDAMRGLDATLVVVGGGRTDVVRAARESLGERFRYLGEVPDHGLPDVYRAADLFCLPSISAAETFGISTVEAMSSGLPAVTTEVGTATSMVNVHGVTGRVVPPADAEALAAAIEALLGDDALRRRCAAAARSRADGEFGRAQMLRRIGDIYSEVMPAAR